MEKISQIVKDLDFFKRFELDSKILNIEIDNGGDRNEIRKRRQIERGDQ